MKEMIDLPIVESMAEIRPLEINKHKDKIGRVIVRPGMVWWELDLTTMLVKRAVMEKERIEIVPLMSILRPWKQVGITHQKVSDLVSRPNCWYDVAINWKNAKRKFLKRIYEKSKQNQPTTP